jgi:hypothetical protein
MFLAPRRWSMSELWDTDSEVVFAFGDFDVELACVAWCLVNSIWTEEIPEARAEEGRVTAWMLRVKSTHPWPVAWRVVIRGHMRSSSVAISMKSKPSSCLRSVFGSGIRCRPGLRRLLGGRSSVLGCRRYSGLSLRKCSWSASCLSCSTGILRRRRTIPTSTLLVFCAGRG